MEDTDFSVDDGISSSSIGSNGTPTADAPAIPRTDTHFVQVVEPIQPPSGWLRFADAARLFGRSKATLGNRIKDGTIRKQRLDDGYFVYNREDILAEKMLLDNNISEAIFAAPKVQPASTPSIDINDKIKWVFQGYDLGLMTINEAMNKLRQLVEE